jgi:alpha-tubulin suppressor-like RCC1 family protein
MYGIDDAVDVIIGEKNIAVVNRDGTIYVTGSNANGVLETALLTQATTEQFRFLFRILTAAL